MGLGPRIFATIAVQTFHLKLYLEYIYVYCVKMSCNSLMHQ